MPTNNTNLDKTVKIFDSFYNAKIRVSGADYDIVNSYFLGVANSKKVADNFTTLFFRIAQEGNYNVLELLELIKGQKTKLEMNRVLAYYLNSFRIKAVLYGVSNIIKPNESVQRNVVL